VIRSRLVNLLLAIAVGVVFVIGLVVHGLVAAGLLLLVAAGLVVLSAAAWSALPARGPARPGRVLVVLGVLVMAGVKLAAS
jgi:hypothetical protein